MAYWGLGIRNLKIIYKGIGKSILLYGSVAWAHRMELSVYAKVVFVWQRVMLIAVCKECRILSGDALHVLTREMKEGD